MKKLTFRNFKCFHMETLCLFFLMISISLFSNPKITLNLCNNFVLEHFTNISFYNSIIYSDKAAIKVIC